MMGSPLVMIILLLLFSVVLGVVVSCYRFDTKAEILESIDTDITSNTTKLSAVMSTGSMSDETDSAKITTYTLSLALLNDAKAWAESNL